LISTIPGVTEHGSELEDDRLWLEGMELALNEARHSGRNRPVVFNEKLQQTDPADEWLQVVDQV